MFLLNNIHDRDYKKIYLRISEEVLFDISDKQLRNKINADWFDIQPNDIVCVINSSRKISRFCRVKGKLQTDVVDLSGNQHVITGIAVGRLPQDFDMTTILNRFQISHPRLRGNTFRIGVNVINLRTALSELEIKTPAGLRKLADVEAQRA
jgi:hypothetical protein